MALKKCKVCKTPFSPRATTQVVCSFDCSLKLLEERKKKEWKERKKLLKSDVKTRQEWLNEAQKTFNKYIRQRDQFKTCISCNLTLLNRKFDAGHYRSVGSCPELRFDEKNVHGQCVPCNQFRSGNLIEFRKKLIERIGVEAVEKLEEKKDPIKLTINEIKELISTYKDKLTKN